MDEKKHSELNWNGRHWILDTKEGPVRFIDEKEYEEWKKEGPKKEEPAPEEE